MTIKPERKKRLQNYKNLGRQMGRENAKFPNHMVQIPEREWPPLSPEHNPDYMPIAVWRSKRFFVQVVKEPSGAVRISVNRTHLGPDYDYVDGITWDELFTIKNQIGYENHDCIEIYPAKDDLVNVANMRHLFVLDHPHPFNWQEVKRKK